jgi:hypothetical protein
MDMLFLLKTETKTPLNARLGRTPGAYYDDNGGPVMLQGSVDPRQDDCKV